jgi:hypothetical protein
VSRGACRIFRLEVRARRELSEDHGDSFCHDRNDIIRNLKRLLAEGIAATIVDTTTGPRGIAAHLMVDWPNPETAREDRVDFYQV